MEMADNIIQVKNYINGSFVATTSGNYIDSLNPSTGQLYAKIPSSTSEDVNHAVTSAQKAFQTWSQSSPQYRSKIMNKIADILESRLDEFAVMESEDQGKPVSLAKKVDIPRAVYNFRFFASSILHTVSDCTQLYEASRAINYVQHVPVGVTGLISPWNLPLYLLTWKIAPAIAFGNTCVAKPSEFTSVTAFKLCEVMKEAGLPDGVVNIVFGYGPDVGEAIIVHPDVPLISFTGSTLVGQRISEKTAPFIKKLSLELGGKNAGVVFSDADFETCVSTCVRSSFANQGEICLCTSRLYIDEKIYDKFLKEFVRQAKLIKVGDPKDPETGMGALVSLQHYNKVRGYIDLAIQSGGTIECGQGIDSLHLPERCKSGYFIPPTVVTGLADNNACYQEEIFGPVVCISPFKTEQEVIDRANNVKYGLSATLWTKDASRLHRVAGKLNAGTVWTNCWLVRDLHMPFGGMKLSGIGRESAKDSHDFFTEAKTICVKY